MMKTTPASLLGLRTAARQLCSGTALVWFLWAIISCLVPALVHAQAPPFEWVRTAGSIYDDQAHAITVDVSGNIYVSGKIVGVVNFGGGQAVGTSGMTGLFGAKYNSSGTLVWVRSYLTSSGEPVRVAIDAGGNMYVAGSFADTKTFGGSTFINDNGLDSVLLKFNPAGNLLWARQGSNSSSDNIIPRALTVDQNTNIHVVGWFSGSASFGALTLSAAGSADIFIVTYDAAGNVLRARKAGGLEYDSANAVVADGANNLFVTGQFRSSPASFNGVLATNRSVGYDDIFLAKYDSAGSIVWVRGAGSSVSTYGEAGTGVATDASGHAIVVGCFNGTATFGTNTLTSAGSLDAFIAKYDPDGNVLWARKAGGSVGDDSSFAVAVDSGGSSYVTGEFRGSASFGSTNLVSLGGADIFFAKYDSQGSLVWARRAGSAFDDSGQGVAVDVFGNSLVAGYFFDSTTFDSTNITGAGQDDIFIAKLPAIAPVPPTITGQPTNQTVTAGANANFSVAATGSAPLNCQWQFNGVNLASATNFSLTISNAQPVNAGGYRAIVSNLGGSKTSLVATLTIGLPASISTPPPSQIVVAGTNTSFTVTAGGTLPLSYQWQFNGTNVVGATNSSLAISNAQPVNGGNYIVVVTNAYGAATSAVATLTVRYSLAVNITGGGSVTRAPNLTLYPPNSSVTLTATPNAGFVFNFWTDDAGGSGNPLGLTMTSNKTITANFVSTALAIAIQGQGTVGKSPDQPFYTVGSQVILSATPGRWFGFTGWGDGPTANPRLVTIGLSNSYTAFFSPTTAVETLTFSNVSRLAPVGMPAIFVDGEFVPAGTVARTGSAEMAMLTTYPNGSIFFTLDGSEPSFSTMLYDGPFECHQSVTVRAVAYDASFLNSWEADPVNVSIQPTYAVNATTPGGGSIALFPASGAYSNGALVTLTATPLPGWTFLQWLGDASGTNPSNTVRVTRDMCVQALFGTGLGTTVAGSGSVLVDPVTPLRPYGSVARLTGVPQAGNFFAAWGNAASGTNNPLLFVVTNANPTVSSVFGALGVGQSALAVVVNGQGRVSTSPRGNRFNTNQTVTLTATPDADQIFLGWSGDASGLGTSLPVLMNQSKVITASFTSRPRFTLGPCLGGQREVGYQFTLTGDLGAHYQIDTATTLPNWTPLATVTNLFGQAQLTDVSATNGVQRFYRARIVP